MKDMNFKRRKTNSMSLTAFRTRVIPHDLQSSFAERFRKSNCLKRRRRGLLAFGAPSDERRSACICRRQRREDNVARSDVDRRTRCHRSVAVARPPCLRRCHEYVDVDDKLGTVVVRLSVRHRRQSGLPFERLDDGERNSISRNRLALFAVGDGFQPVLLCSSDERDGGLDRARREGH